jgi:hypothetical protein
MCQLPRWTQADLGPGLTLPDKEPFGSVLDIPGFGWVKKYFEPIGLLSDSGCRGTTKKVQPRKCLRESAAGLLEMRVR